MKYVSSILIALFFYAGISTGQRANDLLPNPMIKNHFVKLAPNNISVWFANNGFIAQDPSSRGAGWEFPINSKKTICYSAGLVIGGIQDGQIRIGGSTYRTGFQGGEILPDGKPINPNDSTARIYHIRREDADSLTNPDYFLWSAQEGAPVDEAGKPLILGDEQLWYVANDLNPSLTRNLYDTMPIGLELQTTAWGMNSDPMLREVVFVRQRLISKSALPLEQAYIGLWSDFDLGDAVDDRVGVDTTLRLYFTYNARWHDEVYGTPPAAGIVLLQPPLVRSENHTVILNGKRKNGFTFAPLAGFQVHICGDTVLYDWPCFEETPMYNNLRGLTARGSLVIDPTTNKPTRFCVPGNPITGEGWTSESFRGGDCSAIFSVGPITLAPRDTQDVVYALVAAQGIDRLQSLQKVRLITKYIRTWWGVEPPLAVGKASAPDEIRLDQNFPNPFHDQTSISFSLPHRAHVRLKFFDALGREVTTLVDEEREAGVHSIQVLRKDFRRNGCPGVFYYTLFLDESIHMKKMILY